MRTEPEGGTSSVFRPLDVGHSHAVGSAEQARQQAIAELGTKALSGPDLPTLLQEAAALVARVLDVEYGKVLELLADGSGLLLRAGVGWNDGYVGRATVGADRESQAGYTLLWSQPVIVDDLPTETRFHDPLLVDHGVVSGVSVTIPGRVQPLGVLGAYTTERRAFTQEDVSFLQAIANVLALVIEHRRGMEALRESEQRFAAAFHASPLGKCITELSAGCFIDANRQLLEIIGYERDEIIGRRSVELGLIDASRREALMEALQGTGGTQEHEIRIRRKSGEFRDVLVLFSMLEIHAEQCVFTVAKDVTDAKREAEEQGQSAERLRLLAENAQDIIFRYRYTDPPGWEYISPAVTRIGGYTPEEFYADPYFASKIVHPEDREAFDRMEEELQSGPVELRWVRKDGSIIWTEQRNTPVYDQGGNLVAMEGIVRDITEQKRAEGALQEAREQLEAKAERHVRPVNPYDLTFREVTVLHLIADGKADKEIASTLGISALTASKHVANILMKMQAASRTEAGVRAVREELIT